MQLSHSGCSPIPDGHGSLTGKRLQPASKRYKMLNKFYKDFKKKCLVPVHHIVPVGLEHHRPGLLLVDVPGEDWTVPGHSQQQLPELGEMVREIMFDKVLWVMVLRVMGRMRVIKHHCGSAIINIRII
jgi:hypothetical protein